jgi:peptidoglycan/LPS O-acetylase OafA/YrhL
MGMDGQDNARAGAGRGDDAAVTVTRDLEYARGGIGFTSDDPSQRALRLDVYHPPAAFRESGPRPEIVQITFFPILMGVALAHVLHSARGYARVARVVGARWSAPVWVVITLGLAIAPVEDVAGWPRLAIQTSMVVMLAAFVVREDHGLVALTRWAPLARLGVVSYGMYLFHMIARDPVVRVLGRLELESMWLRFGLTTLVTWVVAELSFRYFEKRFLALKERFSTAEHKR